MTNKKAKTAQIYAYETVRDRILQGKYEGQTKLIEDKLAKELQISRTPVREAIRRLEQEGLIKNKRIIKPSPTDIRHMFEMRIVIEGYAASKAAKFMIPDNIAIIRSAIEKAKQSEDPEEIINFNKQFHDYIVKESRNPIMIETVNRMQAIIYMFSHAVVFYNRPFLLDEHSNICDAIEKHDPVEANRLMQEHLQADLEFVLNITD